MRTLTDFDVIHSAGTFGGRGTLIHSLDGHQLVLSVVPLESLEDYFRETGLTEGERALLVDRNLEPFSKIISAKYANGTFESYEKDGRRYPYIVITLEDMRASGLEFSNSVIEMARRSSFSTG